MLMLQIWKVMMGFYGRGAIKEETDRGIQNSDQRYSDLVRAVSAKTSTSDCYFFDEDRDLEYGRQLVPDGMYQQPPPLVQQLMEREPVHNGGGDGIADDDDVLAMMKAPTAKRPKRAAAPKKTRGKGKKETAFSNKNRSRRNQMLSEDEDIYE
ncbi:MAG: hypothetical protein WDW36_000961 [Sanguina aurantia]